MLSRIVRSTLDKLSLTQPPSEASKPFHPTLSFPSPPPTGRGSSSLCARCLTLLSHVITQYGDGTGYKGLEITHSSTLFDPSESGQHNANRKATKNQNSESPNSSSPCVICTKAFKLFNDARAHSAWEKTLRKTPPSEWSLSWRVDAPDPKIFPQFAFPHDSLTVLMSVNHKGGYGWGIGGFKIYPDWNTDISGISAQKENLANQAVIVSLDPNNTTDYVKSDQSEPDFSSTLSTGTLALILSWMQTCAASHTNCHKIFGHNGHDEPGASWFPDRLIHVTQKEGTTTTESSHSVPDLRARIVLKSNPADFPPDKATPDTTYISLSHCWGPPPDPSAPLGGRAGAVLTKANLATWQTDLPLHDLPLAFQHAIKICAALKFEYIWIDSLCIIQDSREDWETQSSVMGDVYKFAWLNVAAMSSTSDYEGFINESRDARVEFGFRAPLAAILGRDCDEENNTGQKCVLLRGRARLIWQYSTNAPGSTSWNAPLFNRAWVYQERCLSRRTIGFTQNTVYWACDESSRSEASDVSAGLESAGLRGVLHFAIETAAKLEASSAGSLIALEHKAFPREPVRELIDRFDMRWSAFITSYTLCKLTKHTDKMIAFSSIARELANSRVINKRYLAGLWDVNLPFQMAWITVEGRTIPPRKMAGDAGYVAPSWSWASIDGPVQPRSIFNFGPGLVALAEVRAAEVLLETEYAFGSVKAGWLRVWGRLNPVKAAKTKAFYSFDKGTKSTSLTDQATGEKLWFSPDTMEGCELIRSEKNLKKMVWMPLTLRFSPGMVECRCVCLIKVESEEGRGCSNEFVRAGEKIYRRIGTGNFGRIPSMLQEDMLVMGLGHYNNIQDAEGNGLKLSIGFERKEDGFEEFVLI
ncbi:hypothetical protein BP6252_11141 [Coleophoma cylindrospora]|uniref:Heterokaryon incompatibility domain-containing protein n=1 Tax=Coleophoma cylindrospora TaxID=1849047 RepID=A0A3D8QP38_9HELO|nr:hypothetical protein BP6252_11141 [Coleophoma cylindrospora]